MKETLEIEGIIAEMDVLWKRGQEIFAPPTQAQRHARPIENKWTISEEFDHVVRANALFTSALKQDEQFYAQFGAVNKAPMTRTELIDLYNSRLEEFSGSGTVRPFKPTPIEDLDSESMLHYWELTSQKFSERLRNKWTEELLDSRFVPHPLLGKLIAREMMYFTIHHTRHHLKSLERKRAAMLPNQ